MPELLRIMKLLGSGDSGAAVGDVLQIPVSLWQAVVPQLLSLLVSSKVRKQPGTISVQIDSPDCGKLFSVCHSFGQMAYLHLTLV